MLGGSILFCHARYTYMSQTLWRGLVALSAMNVEDDLAEQSSRYRGVIVVMTNETRPA